MPRSSPLHPGLRLLRTAFRITGRLAPALAAAWAYRLWFATHRFATPKREIEWLCSAETIPMEYGDGTIHTIQWGHDRPVVLLLHGWSGRASQLGAFAQPLLDAGFNVVAFDAPGHGRSSGKRTTLFEIADVLDAIIRRTGNPTAIISHSFGCLVSAYALRRGVSTDCVILLSSPTTSGYLIDKFSNTLQLTNKVKQRFRHKLELEFGADVWERIDADINARHLSIPALILHDRDDREVDWRCSERLANAWEGAELVYTEHLGHHRILRDHGVINQCIRFIQRHNSTGNTR